MPHFTYLSYITWFTKLLVFTSIKKGSLSLKHVEEEFNQTNLTIYTFIFIIYQLNATLSVSYNFKSNSNEQPTDKIYSVDIICHASLFNNKNNN